MAGELYKEEYTMSLSHKQKAKNGGMFFHYTVILLKHTVKWYRLNWKITKRRKKMNSLELEYEKEINDRHPQKKIHKTSSYPNKKN